MQPAQKIADKPKKKALKLSVKTLEKKTAPMKVASGGNPVIGYC